jgi:hypothetical protein
MRVLAGLSAAPAYGADVYFSGGTDADGNATLSVSAIPDEGGQLAWLGQITNTAPPTLSGEPKTGETIRRTAGQWSGGWDAPWGSRSRASIAACTDARATDCFVISYSRRSGSTRAGRAGT